MNNHSWRRPVGIRSPQARSPGGLGLDAANDSIYTHDAQRKLIAAREEALEASRAKDRIIAEGELTADKLRESETALRQLFDRKLDSMMILNLETGRYIDINDEYIRNSGYRREEVVGKRSRELSSFEYLEENQRLVARLKRVGVVRNM